MTDMKAYLYLTRLREQERKERRNNILCGIGSMLIVLTICTTFALGIMGII